MKIKIFSSILLVLFSAGQAFSWGQTGHRAIGEVASFYIKNKVQKKIDQILKGESLAVSSVWMDNIKSDDNYDHTHDWHWVTIPDGKTYEQTDKNANGDIIMTIKRLIEALKMGGLTPKDEAEYLKMLIHLVGDIHQPLHVGNGEDTGGNAVKLKWFGGNSNLHRVWDSEMIDSKNFSYTELARVVNITNKTQVNNWQNDSVDDWYKEAMTYRGQLYNLPSDLYLGYEYSYKNWDTVKEQLLKAGLRLAAVLNDIYG